MTEEVFETKVVRELGEIKVLVAKQPCKVHKTKIKLLNTIVFGLIGLILLGFFQSKFFPNKAKAETEIKTRITNG